VTKITNDRVMYFDINKSVKLIESNIIIEEVEKAIGELKS